MKILASVAALTFMVAWAVRAPALSITNAGFEADVLGDGGFTNSITGWTIISGAAGTFNPTTAQFSGEAPEGSNTAFSNGGTVYQSLSATLTANTTYTLQVDVGDRLDTILPSNTFIRLQAGSSILPGAVATASGVPDGGFATITTTYTALAGDPLLGQPLVIAFGADGTQANFDNVRLVAIAPVPEPGTLLLLGSGLAALVWRSKRHPL